MSTKIKIVAMYPLAGGKYRINVSILATAHLPLPNPKLTPTCYQLNVFFFFFWGGGGRCARCSYTNIDPQFLPKYISTE